MFPAVIGGYKTGEEAEKAGLLAIAGMAQNWRGHPWEKFTVIPGVAESV